MIKTILLLLPLVLALASASEQASASASEQASCPPSKSNRPLKDMCSMPGCTKAAYWTGQHYCWKHGGGARCPVSGCEGYALAQSGGKCKKHGPLTCRVKGCPNQPSLKGGRCDSHLLPESCCTEEGCPRRGLKRLGGKCPKHGEDTCEVQDCTEKPKKNGRCSRHLLPEDCCTVEGCRRKGLKKLRGKCLQHGGGTCKVQGCTKLPRRAGGTCCRHRLPENCCTVEGCPSEGLTKFRGKCRKHGGGTCVVQGCTNLPRRRGGRCSRHRLPENCCTVEGCPKEGLKKFGGKCRQHEGGTCEAQDCTKLPRKDGRGGGNHRGKRERSVERSRSAHAQAHAHATSPSTPNKTRSGLESSEESQEYARKKGKRSDESSEQPRQKYNNWTIPRKKGKRSGESSEQPQE